MGPRSNNAAVMDAQIKSSVEECAGGMGPISNDAAVMDAQIKSIVEECVKGMGQRLNPNDAALRVVQNMLEKKECA